MNQITAMNQTRLPSILFCLCLSFGLRSAVGGESPTFFRGLNLNGGPVEIDGHAWEGKKAKWYRSKDYAFENNKVKLLKSTDSQRAKMIRSSRYGGNKVQLIDVPNGHYTVFLYLWEDNNSETFDIAVNGQDVVKHYNSGPEGHWDKLGPWPVDVQDGAITLTSRGGTANFSGIEVWRGDYSGIPFAALTPENVAFFESRIRPLLIKHCYECHSLKSESVEGDLFLDSRKGLAKGGTRGPVVVPRDVDHSLLIEAVRYQNSELEMPPEGKLSASEIADLEKWIAMGAPDPRDEQTPKLRQQQDIAEAKDFWSLKPITNPPVPQVQNRHWPANDLDRFILAEIEEHQLKPASDAEKRVLIRRATYDLTGLPPTPEEIDGFLRDKSPHAFETVVERLLASPQYGERWGRHWLDVVRYSDSAGDNSDYPIPQMYRYRNWVIDAFNRDLPYDQFVREQLAGDLLGGKTTEEAQQRLIATGYIANSRRFGSRVSDYPQHLTIEDTIDNLGRAYLGTTINCARCHNHKFDPIPTEDYYAIYGIFHSTRYPWPGIELDKQQRDLVPLVPRSEVLAVQKQRDAQQKKLNAEVKRLKNARKKANKKDRARLDKEIKKAEQKAKNFSRTPLPYEQAYAVADAEVIEDVAVQKKGDPANPGPVVHRRFLTMINGAPLPENDQTSGRLALANWIVDPSNPLTARVMANRIWLYHFGKGLVSTPNDFGRQGRPPSHPQLLDWLATRFIESGWSVKEMHRLIMLSRTYQLSGLRDEHAIEKDTDNQWLAAFPRRRLEADEIRDTLLMLGGNLDFTPGGPHPFPPQNEWNFTQHKPFKAIYETNRRSVYLMTQRIQRHPYLAIFDGPDPAASTPQRLTSTTPLQALYLLNDPFVHEQAKGFADRVIEEESSHEFRIQSIFRQALGRIPTDAEMRACLQLVEQVQMELNKSGEPSDQLESKSWQALCRAVFRLNEFVYLD